MSKKTVRRSLNLTPEMRDLLAQLAAKHGREVREADLIREAIRLYLEHQGDVIGSRRHFQRGLQARLDRMETTLTFYLHVLIHLLLGERGLDDALVAAKRDAQALRQRIDAVRDLEGG